MFKIFLKIKRNKISFLILLFLFFLFIFSSNNIVATKKGLSLWVTCLVPSLFPFLVAIELLNNTNIPNIVGKLFARFMKPIFNVPGEGAYALFMGFICGYPTGAKIVCKLYNDGTFSKAESERLLAFSNNSSPLFIIGTVGISFFGNSTIGFLLFFTHLLSAISVGIIFGFLSRFAKTKSCTIQNKYSGSQVKSNTLNLGESLGNSILSAINTLFIVGGFVVLFSIILSILNDLHVLNFLNQFGIKNNYSIGIFSGVIELTNGLSIITKILTKKLSILVILSAFLIGFSGLCVLLQIYTIISKYKLSIKNYFYGKLLQGCLASLYTYILIYNFNFLNLDL